MLIPKQFLRTIKRTGLGQNLFNDMRFHEDGTPKMDFVLNQKPYDKAEILIAGENFGCGSSREHAPWALLDFGIRCVIAPSYADIFYNNCFKNGILPVTLAQDEVDILMARASEYPSETIEIDLHTCKITAGNHVFDFELDDFRRECLLNGLDNIGLTLEKEHKITAFEAMGRSDKAWLWR